MQNKADNLVIEKGKWSRATATGDSESKIIVAFKNRNANFLIREIVNLETPHIIASLVLHQVYESAGWLHPLI